MSRCRTAKIELERYDWSGYRAPSGDGRRVADVFGRLFDVDCSTEVVGLSLENKLEVQGMVFEVALPATGVILAAFADGDSPGWAECELLNTLAFVVGGEPHRSELELGNYDLVDRCIAAARDGIWVMYSYLARNNSPFMLNILDLVDEDRDRFSAFERKFENSVKRRQRSEG